jgi:hypothetical protein
VTARRVLRELAVFAFYFALALWMTWPLGRQLNTALPDLGDPMINMWTIDWVCHALTHAPLHLYEAPIYYPAHLTLAFSENLIGVAVAVLPFHLAGVPPIAVYNLAVLLGFALSGYAAFVLARLVTGSVAAALVAGVVYAFVPHKFDHLSHVQIVWSAALPFLFAALLAYWRNPARRYGAGVAASLLLAAITNVYYFLFALVTLALTLAALQIADPRRDRRFWTGLVLALAIGGIATLPFLLPYRIVSKTYHMTRGEGEAIGGSGTPSNWLYATPRSTVYGDLGAGEMHQHEKQLFPGLVALFLAVIGAFAGMRRVREEADTSHSRRSTSVLNALILIFATLTYLGIVTDRIEWSIGSLRILSFNTAESFAVILLALLTIRFAPALRAAAAQRSSFSSEAGTAAVWIAIGYLGSLGMHAFFHAFLYRRIPLFHATRASVRWAIVAYMGLAVWSAIGAVAILDRCRSRRSVMAALLVALTVADLWPVIRWEHAVPTIAPVYRWLAARPQLAPLIELPMSGNGSEMAYLLGSTAHHLRQFNGISTFSDPVHARLRRKADAGAYDDDFLRTLESYGCRLVIVHAHLFPKGAPRAWLARNLASGRLAFLRSFDHEVGGDYAFAVTRNLRDCAPLREPHVPDGAGHMPEERLARMLAGETTHSDAIMAMIDTPQPYDGIRGALHIRGWALSPHGIRRAIVLLDNARVRIDATLVERADVRAMYTWYYFVPRPGFVVDLPRRPKNVPRQTQFQIEIEDAAHRVIRTSDVPIDWGDE